MGLKEYLQSLEWNTFSKYPEQGENIFLHCTSDDGEVHRFLKINNFNATKLNFDKILQYVSPNRRWLYTWLPADIINEDHV